MIVLQGGAWRPYWRTDPVAEAARAPLTASSAPTWRGLHQPAHAWALARGRPPRPVGPRGAHGAAGDRLARWWTSAGPRATRIEPRRPARHGHCTPAGDQPAGRQRSPDLPPAQPAAAGAAGASGWRRAPAPTVIAGDLNMPGPVSGRGGRLLTRRCTARTLPGPPPAACSFDQMLDWPGRPVRRTEGCCPRFCSDHLPIRACLQVV